MVVKKRFAHEHHNEGHKIGAKLRSREAILSAISQAAEGLCVLRKWEETLPRFLEQLGVATNVSRVYLFENHTDENGALLTSQRYEWARPGVSPQIDNPELQDFPYEVGGFTRWQRELSRRKPIYGLVKDFPEPERAILEAQDIISIAIVPIFSKERWFGFLGFDECLSERIWDEAEIDALRIAADIIGAAVSSIREEMVLRESEMRYRNLVEHSFDGIYIHKGSRIIFANKRMHEIVGYDNGGLLGKEFWSIYDPEYREIVQARAEARKKGENPPSQYEVVLCHKDGSPVFAELSTKMIEVDGEPASHVWIRDITDKKESEKALSEAEHKYRSIFENALEGIFQSTPDGRFVTANPALARIYGYDSAEELMRQVTDIGKQIYADPEQRQEFLERIGRGEYLKGYEVKARRKDGTIVFTSVNAYGVKNKNGNLRLIEGFIEDITEKKRAEEERKRLEAEYRHAQKMEAIGTLAGGIAHDFNNLLQGIMGYTEILLVDKDKDDSDMASLTEIAKAARKASELTQRLLTFSRKVEAKPRPLNLNAQVREVEKILRRTLPKMIDIETVLADRLATVNADPVQIEQILMNLAINARDAMPEGGRLVIETENVEIDEEYCSSHLGARPGRYVLLSVSDTGHGMDKEVVEHIFEPFYTTKEPGKGTGLGLPMVYGIVKSHGGYIGCYSTPGIGTSFKLYFPVLALDISEEESVRCAELDVKGGNEVILIVDDEDVVRSVAERILRKFGYNVLTARNGQEGIEIYKGKGREISLVILDMVMPGMDGKQCLKELLYLDPEVKIVIASGYSDTGPIRDLLGQGAKAAISKPYEAKRLLQIVREIIDETSEDKVAHQVAN